MAIVDQGFEREAGAAGIGDAGLQRLLAVLIDELIDQHLAGCRPGQAVVGAAFLLPRLHALGVAFPKCLVQFAGAGIEQIGILEHLVVEVVLRLEAQRAGLDAHVDVLRHQDHLALRRSFGQVQDDAEDLVVAASGRQAVGQADTDRLGLQEQPAGGQAARRSVELDALGDAVFARTDDLVEAAAGLTRVARHFGHALLVVVQFFQRHDRHVDVVLLEAEQAGRVVHQDIGVEHEELGRGGFRDGAACGHRAGSVCDRDQRERADSSTSAACPGTLTLRHSRAIRPSASIRKVERSMPRTWRPYMFLSFIT